MASRILSQDEARARRGPIEGPWLRPGSSEQRSSCGRRRSQHNRSNGIVPATNCVLIDTGPGILSLTRFMVAWAWLTTASKYPDTVAPRDVADIEVDRLAVGMTEHALDSG